MSRDGPQSGPYQPDEPYHPPSDPWDGQDPWGGPTMPNAPYGGGGQSGGWPTGSQETAYVPGSGYGAPTSPVSTGYGYPPQQPAWAAPAAPPPPSRRSWWLIALVAVLVLVVAGGVSAALFLLRDPPGGGDATPTAGPTATATPTATGEPEPSAQTTVGLEAAFARPDDCVVNVGTEDAVELQIVDCDDPGVAGDTTLYQVLTRYDGGPANQDVAEEKCGEDPGVGNYTNWYYFDSPTPELSFVLCLNEIEPNE